MSELPPHAEPDNKNPPKIDSKSEIDLDPHAITGNSNDINSNINLLKFALKNREIKTSELFVADFYYLESLCSGPTHLAEKIQNSLSVYSVPVLLSPQTIRSKQAKII